MGPNIFWVLLKTNTSVCLTQKQKKHCTVNQVMLDALLKVDKSINPILILHLQELMEISIYISLQPIMNPWNIWPNVKFATKKFNLKEDSILNHNGLTKKQFLFQVINHLGSFQKMKRTKKFGNFATKKWFVMIKKFQLYFLWAMKF